MKPPLDRVKVGFGTFMVLTCLRGKTSSPSGFLSSNFYARYLGYFVVTTRCTVIRVWYAINWCTDIAPVYLSSSSSEVSLGRFVCSLNTLFWSTWSFLLSSLVNALYRRIMSSIDVIPKTFPHNWQQYMNLLVNIPSLTFLNYLIGRGGLGGLKPPPLEIGRVIFLNPYKAFRRQLYEVKIGYSSHELHIY